MPRRVIIITTGIITTTTTIIIIVRIMAGITTMGGTVRTIIIARTANRIFRTHRRRRTGMESGALGRRFSA